MNAEQSLGCRENVKLNMRSHKRRTKPQLSCLMCKQKKLKCDRARPCCKHCARYPSGTCIYVTPVLKSHALTKRNPRSNEIHERIDELETLVHELASGKNLDHLEGSDESHTEGRRSSKWRTDAALDSNGSIRHLMMNDDGTVYLGPAHWGAIIERVGQLKHLLLFDVGNETHHSEPESESEITDTTIPELLSGAAKNNDSLMDIICSMPPKNTCDEILHVFITSPDIPSFTFHIPTLQIEYALFWENPADVSLPWLAMLNALMAFTLQFSSRSGANLSSVRFPEHLANLSNSRAARLLVLSDYTKPQKYTVEAMLAYCICEHLRPNSEFQIQLLFGMVFQIAIRAGYHQGPRHYPGISIFEGELRRRAWAVIAQFQYLTAFACGLPVLINESKCDTEPPRSLIDDDLSPGMIALPESRPESEVNWITYTNYKLAWLRMLSMIIDETNQTEELTPSQAMSMNQKIDSLRNKMPAWLHSPARTDLQGLTATEITRVCFVYLIERRSRMLLHRCFLDSRMQNSNLNLCRQICLSSAVEALRYQNELHDMSQISSHEATGNWRFFAFMAHDLILPAIIICVEIQQSRNNTQTITKPYSSQTSIDELLDLLQISYRNWTGPWKHFSQAKAAVSIVRKTLQKMRPDFELQTPLTNVPPAEVGRFLFDDDLTISKVNGIAPQTWSTIDQSRDEPPCSNDQAWYDSSGILDMMNLDQSQFPMSALGFWS